MVEWKKLGEIGTFIRGNGIQKKDFIEDGYECIHYGQIHTQYGISATETISKIGYTLYNKSKKAQKGDVILATTSEDAEGVAKPVVWLGDTDVAVSGDAFIFHHNQNGMYIAYHFLTDRFMQFKIKNATGAKVVRISGESMAKFEIPIPSLSEQQRIVGILDTFTSSIENLKEQIAQRRKQYEYYRDQLLDLEGKEGVEMKTLGEVCEIKGRIGFRGYTREDQVEEGEGVISLSPGNIENGQMVYKGCTYITWEKYEESPEIKTYDGDILFCKTGSTVGKVAMVKELPCEATINPQLVVLKDITIDSKFLNYILGTYTIQSTVKRLAGVGSVPNISQEKLGNLKIPLPPLSEQQRIVSILDTFEASINNLEQQLAQREKQYEFYRNKLLTFE